MREAYVFSCFSEKRGLLKLVMSKSVFVPTILEAATLLLDKGKGFFVVVEYLFNADIERSNWFSGLTKETVLVDVMCDASGSRPEKVTVNLGL